MLPDLITRKCRCGCGGTWRTLPTSQWHYFGLSHAKKDGHEIKYDPYFRGDSYKEYLGTNDKIQSANEIE